MASRCRALVPKLETLLAIQTSVRELTQELQTVLHERVGQLQGTATKQKRHGRFDSLVRPCANPTISNATRNSADLDEGRSVMKALGWSSCFERGVEASR